MCELFAGVVPELFLRCVFVNACVCGLVIGMICVYLG